MIHIRNCRTPTDGTSSSYYKWSTWMHREALLVGRWTEVDKSVDAAWASNYSATYSDLVVDPIEPNVVRRASGGVFSTPPANSALSLVDPVNDENCLIANIIGYSTTALYLDGISFAKPFVAATGLVGRVHVYGQTNLLAAGAWVVLAAPGTDPDRFQVRFEVGTTANRPWMYAYPRGDFATTKLITSGLTWAFDGSERRTILNADIDGENFMIWNYPKTTAAGFAPYTTVWAGGRLTEVATGDTYPLFITANANTSWGAVSPPWDWCQTWPLCMLGYFNEQVTGYMEHIKYFSDATYTSGIWAVDRWFIVNGKYARQYPFAVMGDVAGGGFKRGRMPWRAIHESWVDWSTTDGLGETRAAPGKMMLPRAGEDGCDLIVPPLTYFT